MDFALLRVKRIENEKVAKAKLVCEKNQFSSKEHEQKLKTWMGDSTGNAD